MRKVLTVGTISADEGKISGCAAYVAAGLVKLGVGAAVCAKIKQEDSEAIRAFFAENGIDDEMLFTDGERFDLNLSGISAVFVTGDFAVNDLGFGLLKDFREKCESLQIPLILATSNHSESPDRINNAASGANVFLTSIEDAQKLCGLSDAKEIAEHYLSLGAHKIVVTLDKQGAFYKSRVECGSAPTFRADRVVDTTGAGDAFAAGLTSGIIEELPLGEAVVRANACGCMAIQHEGLYMPTADKLREYMLSHRFVVDGCKDF
ncbi:MAG: bifunctional hydroxymethylpyrimidine kinase/phosphomethylpyrimidine kinase [Oscillospiraceae bacterium]|nr:bifunctional hydroxymethylpyrimidine kinase/phosphomethylpyrimidine kinase [Oscillospiraceae bacterium]